MRITDKKTGRSLEIENCYHVDILGNFKWCKILGKNTDKDSIWFGMYDIQYKDGERLWASAEDLVIKIEDAIAAVFGKKRKK